MLKLFTIIVPCIPIYRPLNSEGKPCSRPLATAFVGLYKDECRLWTRRHCLYKDGDGKKATKERARNAEYWFLYRNDTKKEVVNGEKLILQDQDLLWDKVYHIYCTLYS